MQSSLADLLKERRDAIVAAWFDRVAATYAPETVRFLKREKDGFSNPVGGNILRGLRGVYDGLLSGADAGALRDALDRVIRIRSVQDFSASEAVAFVFLLKGVVREALARPMREPRIREEFQAFEARVDELGLAAFDVYMSCREKLHEIRTSEVKRRSSQLFERLGAPGACPGKGCGS
ncbi:MAG: RsbRD N-terminal domain-containing protein [Elusimicrobiota bacterium]